MSLFSKFLQEALNDSSIDLNVLEAELQNFLNLLIEKPYDNFTEHLKQHQEVIELRSGILDKLEMFKKTLNNQAPFLHNFMAMIEGLFLSVCVTMFMESLFVFIR